MAEDNRVSLDPDRSARLCQELLEKVELLDMIDLDRRRS